MKRKWLNSFTVALLLTLVSIFMYSRDFALFNLLELKSYDLKMRARGERPVSGQVVIAAIDEKSLAQEGRWPWPRTILARLVDRLSEAQAAVIGFDIFFPEKDSYVPFQTVRQAIMQKDLTGMDKESLIGWLEEASDSDRQFAEAIMKTERTVLGFFASAAADEAGQPEMDASMLELLSFFEYSIVQRFDDPEHPVPLRPIHALGLSIPELTQSANSAGFVSFIPEMDGVVRRVPMVMQFREGLYPPLSLQILQQATQMPLAVRVAPFGVDGVRVGESLIPTTETGDFLVNFSGPGYTFTHFPVTDILSGKIGAKELANKLVLVGVTAAGTHDIHVTPYDPLFPGVEVHANIIENVLGGDFLIRPDWLAVLDLATILVSGLLLGLASLYSKAILMALVLVAGIGGYVSADYYMFSRMGLWVNSVFPVFTQVFVYSGITLYKLFFEEREKRFIKGAFGQYLAPAVVEQLTANPGLLKLGGERKVLTAFFSDVAGFSTISEKLSPEELVDLLNAYLTEMTDIIMKYEGTVDKFEGDAIIAFFGAPVPYDDHARRACLVSIEMQKRLGELRQQWKEEGRPELFMRIGLNTGPMVVGNMGSKTRMDYTMMGDSVNLAARLEGVNKQYGTYTMCSEFTYEQVREFVETRELDLIRVVGKEEPVRIFEILGEKGELREDMREALPLYSEGLTHYRNLRWEEALQSFEKVLEIVKDDGPSLTFFQRCVMFQSKPPPDNWDGVFSMTSK